MPWNVKDATSFTRKAKTTKAKKQWKSVANSVLGSGASEGTAIKTANGVIKKRTKKV